ncbi:MAG: hypothetical protein Q9179_007941, partial [Wetmoreana sp. 5 TL-2023]
INLPKTSSDECTTRIASEIGYDSTDYLAQQYRAELESLKERQWSGSVSTLVENIAPSDEEDSCDINFTMIRMREDKEGSIIYMVPDATLGSEITISMMLRRFPHDMADKFSDSLAAPDILIQDQSASKHMIQYGSGAIQRGRPKPVDYMNACGLAAKNRGNVKWFKLRRQGLARLVPSQFPGSGPLSKLLASQS